MKNLEERAKKRVENINIKELLNSPDDVIMRFLICELAEFHKHELNRIIPNLEELFKYRSEYIKTINSINDEVDIEIDYSNGWNKAIELIIKSIKD